MIQLRSGATGLVSMVFIWCCVPSFQFSLPRPVFDPARTVHPEEQGREVAEIMDKMLDYLQRQRLYDDINLVEKLIFNLSNDGKFVRYNTNNEKDNNNEKQNDSKTKLLPYGKRVQEKNSDSNNGENPMPIRALPNIFRG